ncbi:hypothetical protein [Lactobacillus sp. PSON]
MCKENRIVYLLKEMSHMMVSTIIGGSFLLVELAGVITLSIVNPY